jgi:hypothetical protein
MEVAARVEAGGEVEEIAHLSDDDWDAAVSGSQLPFRFSHRTAAGRAFEAAYPSYQYEPYRVSYLDGTIALFPLIRVARRARALTMFLGMASGWEGTPLPVAGEVRAAHVRSLFRALGGTGRLVLHGGAGGLPPRVGKEIVTTAHTLDLRPGWEELWAGFSRTNRKKFRRAERAGVEISRPDTPEAQKDYYGLYKAATRSWGYSQPPFPQALFDALLDSDSAELWLAYLDEQPIAGEIWLGGSDDLFAFTAAMDSRYTAVGPGNAVRCAAIESACQRGVSYIDFGGSIGLPGVETFKESFGARKREFRTVELSSPGYRRLERWRARLSKVVPGS